MAVFKLKPLRKSQGGVALVVSLVILIALTILGISTLRGSRLSEKVVHNSQMKAVTFEAAESAINLGFTSKAMLASQENLTPENWNNPEPVKSENLQNQLLNSLNLSSPDGGIMEVTAEVSIQFCGESLLPKGTSLSADESVVRWAAIIFDVNGIATVDDANAISDHLKEGSLTRPSAGRQGNCVAR